MPKPDIKSVDDYIAAQPEAVRPLLERVRRTIRKALPSVTEAISYRIPTFKLPGGAVLYVAAWKQHWSLYPATARVVATFADELAAYEVEKGTIRFPLAGRLPTGLIARIAKLRADEVTEGRKRRKTAR